MYRHLLPLLLCQAVAAAPQSMSDSDITYVMLQPPVEAPAAPTHSRESRIENLQLTIPGTVTFDNVNTNLTDKVPTPTENIESEATSAKKESEQSDQTDANLPESSNLSEVTVLPDTAALPEANEETIVPEITGVPQQTDTFTAPEESVLADTNPDDKQTLPDVIDLAEKDELLEAHGSGLSDTIPSESERRGRTYDSSETTDIFEEATVKYEEATEAPKLVDPRTRETPKFVPKLSYFQKPQVFVSFPTNTIEKSAKRRFRSNCRCEKIWNCPKLQISVPRCPNEYFLCCF